MSDSSKSSGLGEASPATADAALKIVGSYLGVRDFANYGMVNKSLHAFAVSAPNIAKLKASHWMAAHAPLNMKGSLLQNSENEALAIRALIDSGLVALDAIRSWNATSAEQQAALKKNFTLTNGTPDMIMNGIPADFVSSNPPDAARIPGSAEKVAARVASDALSALGGVPEKVRAKWKKYAKDGGGRCACIVYLHRYPREISNLQIMKSVVGALNGEQGDNELYVVRDLLAMRWF